MGLHSAPSGTSPLCYLLQLLWKQPSSKRPSPGPSAAFSRFALLVSGFSVERGSDRSWALSGSHCCALHVFIIRVFIRRLCLQCVCSSDSHLPCRSLQRLCHHVLQPEGVGIACSHGVHIVTIWVAGCKRRCCTRGPRECPWWAVLYSRVPTGGPSRAFKVWCCCSDVHGLASQNPQVLYHERRCGSSLSIMWWTQPTAGLALPALMQTHRWVIACHAASTMRAAAPHNACHGL
jgi:hypothetical protein